MEVGRKYRVKPEMIVGKDGVTYPVIAVQASGRGWSSRNYYTPGAGVSFELEVEVLAHDGYKGAYERATKVKVLKGGDIKMYRFAKKPYVRKDGSFNVLTPDYLAGTVGEGEPPSEYKFSTAYAFWNGEGYLQLKKEQVEVI